MMNPVDHSFSFQPMSDRKETKRDETKRKVPLQVETGILDAIIGFEAMSKVE